MSKNARWYAIRCAEFEAFQRTSNCHHTTGSSYYIRLYAYFPPTYCIILETASLYSNNYALSSILISFERKYEALDTKTFLGMGWKHQNDSLGASVSVSDLSGVTSGGQNYSSKIGDFRENQRYFAKYRCKILDLARAMARVIKNLLLTFF